MEYSNKTKLETILDMVTYLSKFSQNLSNVMSLMSQLLGTVYMGKTPSWRFLKRQEHTNTALVLIYFDPSKPITLQIDTSKDGLGAAFLQEGKPTVYVFKSFIESEINYT